MELFTIWIPQICEKRVPSTQVRKKKSSQDQVSLLTRVLANSASFLGMPLTSLYNCPPFRLNPVFLSFYSLRLSCFFWWCYATNA